MANAKVWKNVAVAMESARAAAKTITVVTKAKPGVASSTAHGFANGDILNQRQRNFLAHAGQVDHGTVVVAQFNDLRGNGQTHGISFIG